MPLYELFHFAAGSNLYSHILLIPFVAVYLWWGGRDGRTVGRPDTPTVRRTSDLWLPTSILFLTAGAATLGAYLLTDTSGLPLKDRLAWTTLSFLLCFWGLCAHFATSSRNGEVRSQTSDVSGHPPELTSDRRAANRPTVPPSDGPAAHRLPLTAYRFPSLFLIFLIPFPAAVEAGIEDFLQHGSAEAADWLFTISGMTFFRDGTAFHLPGFSLEVAPECSGIHSSLVLFITSLVAGHLFLHTTWKRWALALLVIPLALVRNGIRVVVIGHLCVYVGPDMIHSYIHRQGGPIFFGLSLIPFTVILYLLWRSESGRPVRP